VLGERNGRHHHVEAGDPAGVAAGERRGEEVCLLLVVPLDADPVALLEDGLEHLDRPGVVEDLGGRDAPGAFEAAPLSFFKGVPLGHGDLLRGHHCSTGRPVVERDSGTSPLFYARDPKIFADLVSKMIHNFIMARDSRSAVLCWIEPPGVTTTFPNEYALMLAKVFE